MKLINDDCLSALKTLEDNSIDSLVTDPPAGISFMNKDWDKDKGGRDSWIAWITEVMTECLRVMKPGAHGFVWAIPRTSHWTATALENAGFEIRDIVTHLFGSGFPKSHNISKAIDKKFGKDREVVGINENHRSLKPVNTMCSAPHSGKGDITKPSTDQAKQWDGWGSATKPAVEMWLLVAKPFTTVPLDDIVSEVNSTLRSYICQQLDAKFVEKISMSNLKDLRTDEMSDFAQWIVVVLNTLRKEALLEKMDMFKSQEMARIFLNIVSSWKSILNALLNMENKYIIKMETNLITELKILNSLISEIILEDTIKEEMTQDGKLLNAMNVSACLKNALQKLIVLMETIVQENAFIKMENLQRQPHHMPKYAPEISKECLSEHWILVRKPLSEKSIVDNVLKHGVGGINIDECRVEYSEVEPNLRENKGNWCKENVNHFGKIELGKRPPPSPQGRFPANLVLSGDAPEMLDEQSGVCKTGDIKAGTMQGFGTGKNTYGEGSIPREYKTDQASGASRFFYCPKASKSERGKDNNHPCVKSQKLMQYLIKMITPPNGTVLDPFMGSGSTGVACETLGFNFIGIEQDLEYFKIGQSRIGGKL